MSPDTICCCGAYDKPWPAHGSWCRVHTSGEAKSTATHQAPPRPGSDMRDPHLLVDVREPCTEQRTHTVWVVLYEDKWGTWRTGSRAWHDGSQAYAHLGRLVADGKVAKGRVESTQVTIDQEVK